MDINQIKLLAEGTETRTIRNQLQEPEINELRAEVTDSIVQNDVYKDELDQIKADYKQKMDPLKNRVKLATRTLRLGYREEVVECYKVPNQETGMMEFYDYDGVLVDERRLTQSERQLRIPAESRPLKAVNS